MKIVTRLYISVLIIALSFAKTAYSTPYVIQHPAPLLHHIPLHRQYIRHSTGIHRHVAAHHPIHRVLAHHVVRRPIVLASVPQQTLLPIVPEEALLATTVEQHNIKRTREALAKENTSCQHILNKCSNKGFMLNQWKENNGLWRDCFFPIVDGNAPLTQHGKQVSVPVNPTDKNSCYKAISTNLS